MKIRRVVTGHTPDGKATVASDMEVDAINVALWPGGEHYRLWGADVALTFPDDGALRPTPTFSHRLADSGLAYLHFSQSQ